MRRLLGLASVAGMLAFATGANAETLAAFDQLFLRSEARVSAYERDLAVLAQERAVRPSVKLYAGTLVQDHERYQMALRELAAKKNVTLEPAPSAQNKATLDHLKRLKGAAFDSAFIAEVRRVNGASMRAFRAEASKTTDPEIRHFVSEFLAMDERHDALAHAALPPRGMPVIKPPMTGPMPVIPPPSGGTTPVIPPPK